MISGSGVLYTPEASFLGTDTFTYTVSDGLGGTDEAMVTITVRQDNQPPAANDDSANTAMNAAVQIAVLANDSDPDGDTLQVIAVSTPGHGTAVISGSGVLYTPAAGFFGTDTFSYTVSDGLGGTDTATVTVTVSETQETFYWVMLPLITR